MDEFYFMSDDDMQYWYDRACDNFEEEPQRGRGRGRGQGRGRGRGGNNRKPQVTSSAAALDKRFQSFIGPSHISDRRALYETASIEDLRVIQEGQVLKWEGNRDNINYLVSRGINVDASGKEGNTALHWAVIYNSPENCSALLAAGANPNALNKRGLTPMMDCQDSEVARIMVAAKGCDLDIKAPDGTNAARVAIRVDEPTVACIIAEHMKRFDLPTMMDAIRVPRCDNAVVALLKLKDCDLNRTCERDGMHFTPIQYAIRHAGHPLLKHLLNHKSAANQSYMLTSIEFEEAIRNLDIKSMTKILIKSRSSSRKPQSQANASWNINCRPLDKYSTNILSFAITYNYYGKAPNNRILMIQLLLDEGADPNGVVTNDWCPAYRDGEGAPLDAAIKKWDANCIKMLIGKGAKPTQKNLIDGLGYSVEFANSVLDSGCHLDGKEPSWTLLEIRGARHYANANEGEELALAHRLLDRINNFDMPVLKAHPSINKIILSCGGGMVGTSRRVNSAGDSSFMVLARSYCDVLHGHSNPMTIASMQLMLDNGCDIDAANDAGETALTLAVCNQSVALTKMLLDNGADRYVRDSKGRTLPERYAQMVGEPSISRILPMLRLQVPPSRAPPPPYPIDDGRSSRPMAFVNLGNVGWRGRGRGGARN